jgi:exosortase/archaeosortase family protein
MNVRRPNGSPRFGRPGRMALALVLWLALFAGSTLLYNLTFHRTSPVLVRWLQVAPSAVLLEWTLPGVAVTRLPTALRIPGLEVQLLRGCDGMEAWLMLMSALLVFPFPWRRRLLGALWGSLLVFGLNLLRIVSLFHVALRRPDWFEIAHSVLWQSAMVIAVAAFILAWFRPAPEAPARTGDAA